MGVDGDGKGSSGKQDVSETFGSTAKVDIRTTAGGYLPYLYTIIALLSTLCTTRQPVETFTSSAQFSELIIALATVLDVMEAKSHTGKETARDARSRRKINIRTWRLLRQVRNPFLTWLILITASGGFAKHYGRLTNKDCRCSYSFGCAVGSHCWRSSAPEAKEAGQRTRRETVD